MAIFLVRHLGVQANQNILVLHEMSNCTLCAARRPVNPLTASHTPPVEGSSYISIPIDSSLKWDRHCSVTYKKCQQRLYCLRKRRSFNIDSTILSIFSKVCIQSVLTFSFSCCFGNVRQKDKNNFQRIVDFGIKATGLKQSTLTALYEKWLQFICIFIPFLFLYMCIVIINYNIHIRHNEYVLLPSSRRFRTITSKTNRKRDSFIPMTVYDFSTSMYLYV